MLESEGRLEAAVSSQLSYAVGPSHDLPPSRLCGLPYARNWQKVGGRVASEFRVGKAQKRWGGKQLRRRL